LAACLRLKKTQIYSANSVFEPVEEADDGPQSVRTRAAADLTPEAIAAITDQVRIRVLRWFARSGLIECDDVREMRAPSSPPRPTAASRWMPRCAWARCQPKPSWFGRSLLQRSSPAWDEAPEPASDWDLVAQPEPELELDQRIAW